MTPVGGVKPAVGPPGERPEQSSLGWLWLLVAFQVLVPASYYMRADVSDERFAWRMFSVVRVERCSVRAYASGANGAPREVDVESVLHSGWITGLERGRTRVIQRFLGKLCSDAALKESGLRRECEDAAGARHTEFFRMPCSNLRMSREAAP